MKKNFLLLFLALLSANLAKSQNYIVLGWNDLGMHCANKTFANLVILPPYNNFLAQVIKVGDLENPPEIITEGVTVEYSIPGNTYSVGKTDFWTYAEKIFGVKLADNIGLKGLGLAGNMSSSTDHFIAEGIPITPYQDNDLVNEAPYQLAKLVVKDSKSSIIATTQNVMPVSNEISCVSSGCHNSEQSILNAHEQEGGFNPNNKPIMCASCHGSNALGLPSKNGLQSVSYVVHNRHRNFTTDCYKCHPGPKTKCFRDVMFSGGKKCQDCHGTMAQVASSQNSGRRPWLDEPKCGQSGCHAAQYAEETGKLYRESKGHHGVYCSACHGSPHAIVPTVQPNDNQQNIGLQGFEGKLKKCSVCHGFIPSGAGPHGFIAPAPAVPMLVSPAKDSLGVPTNHQILWEKGENCDNYRLQISTSEFFETIILDSIVNLNSFRSNLLKTKTKYFWKVKGTNDYGEGFWSETWNFTTSDQQAGVIDLNLSRFHIEFNKSFSKAFIGYLSLDSKTPDLSVINLLGVQLLFKEGYYTAKDAEILDELDINSINNGIYFLIFRKENSAHIEKFIINR